jgi:hypothetical protein
MTDEALAFIDRLAAAIEADKPCGVRSIEFDKECAQRGPHEWHRAADGTLWLEVSDGR